MKKILARGAEAVLIKKDKTIEKTRIKKSYRQKQLDVWLRSSRTKRETRLLEKASLLVPVPKIKRVKRYTIEMQFIDGKKLSEWLDKMEETKALEICKEIGKNIAKLHEANIIHGDLTTSNMIYDEKQKKVFFIDFGLGFHSARIEDKAVDLHLLAEALKSKHFKRWQNYFREVIKNYRWKEAKKVLEQLEKVELRGRYKKK
ncbi:MAG: KEOPS complex kinase/ATPase Bud32 [Candidatus Pacearchaeota archaeon]|nr:KEOPS complex kinase/ATPase Bud32 [Candidatus Pacearchaeota archaeon]